MNSIDHLSALCSERKLAWSIETDGTGPSHATIYARWPIALAKGSGHTVYGAAKQAAQELERRPT